MTMMRVNWKAQDEVVRATLLAGVALVSFFLLPWLLMACRALGMPAWIYGADPLVGWLRLWAMLPAWLLLVAFGALVFAAVRSERV